MVKVVCFSPIAEPLLKALLSSVYSGEVEIEVINEYDEQRILEAVRDADVIIGDYTFKIPVTEKMMKVMEKVKLIQQPSTGYNHIDVNAAKKLNIPVANVGGVNALSVAEHTIMFALALLKKLLYAHNSVLARKWEQDEMANLGVYELYGKTWGILGMGAQGREVTKRLQGWDVRIIYYDIRRAKDVEEKYGAEYRDFESLLKESDIVSIHLPLTEETRGMIGEKELKIMKSSAILINVARGEIVDEEALVKALKEKWIAGAALDVFAKEPPEGSKLLELKDCNVIFSPHIAGATNEARLRIIREAMENIGRALRGEEIKHVVSR
ncbi:MULTISPECIES: 2-hydroxyacid dehydrogenase [unclassified Archaeoglobus]|jgi:glyoxylate reductase|uniref:2-hydroxyacid dehydrogenase n=1 Tax=unclassified Archaeoglobus TaxID=2643606 RepID=UPI0025C5961B|nr:MULTISPECIES: 2-hydroxyacid dehydrogenase [unclassified Archaeoglobus]